MRAKAVGTAATEEPERGEVDLEVAARDSNVVKLTNLVLITAFKDKARVLLGPGSEVGNLRVTLSPHDGSRPRRPDWASILDDGLEPDLYPSVLRRLGVMMEFEPTSGDRGAITLRIAASKTFSFRVAFERGDRGLLAVVDPLEGPALPEASQSPALAIARTNADRLTPAEQPTLWEHAVRAIEGEADLDALFFGLEGLVSAWAQIGEYERALEVARRAAALYADVEDSPWRQSTGLWLLAFAAELAGDEETERSARARAIQVNTEHGPRADLLDTSQRVALDTLAHGRLDVALSALESVRRFDIECFGAPTTASLISDSIVAWIASRGLGIDERIAALEARARALSLSRSPEQHRMFLTQLGRIARRAGMTTDAEHYTRASISPRDHWQNRCASTFRLAVVLADAGKLDQVEQAIAQARALVPAGVTPEPWLRAREALAQARLHEERGQLDDARTHYAKAGPSFMADLDLLERARKLGVDLPPRY